MQDNSIKFSPIKDRILQYAEYKGITANKIYTQSGITRGVLGQKNGISESNLSKFLDTYQDANPTWITVGKGEMILTTNVAAEPTAAYGQDYRELYFELLEENRVLMKEMSVKLGKDKNRINNVVLNELQNINTKIDNNKKLIQSQIQGQKDGSKKAG